MFHAAEVATYLLKQDLVRPSHIVNGGVEIVSAARRNRNYKVRVTGGPSVLLKQGSDPHKRATLAHEAGVYRFLRCLPSPAVRSLVPGYRGFDPDESVLALELIEETESLLDRHTRTGRLPLPVARRLGRSLATLHRDTASAEVRERFHRELTPRVPDALVLHAPSLTFYGAYASYGNIRLLSAVRRSDDLFCGLDLLREEWREECLVHADLRWDNCLVGRKRQFKIVDWELATLGDPSWDVGCVFAEHLNFWLSSAPMTSRTSPEAVLATTRAPLPRIQTALAAFWGSYVAARALSANEAEVMLMRAVRHAAARLFQTAIEQTQASTSLSALAVYQLQLSANLLRRPRLAAADLLGLTACDRESAA